MLNEQKRRFGIMPRFFYSLLLFAFQSEISHFLLPYIYFSISYENLDI